VAHPRASVDLPPAEYARSGFRQDFLRRLHKNSLCVENFLTVNGTWRILSAQLDTNRWVPLAYGNAAAITRVCLAMMASNPYGVVPFALLRGRYRHVW